MIPTTMEMAVKSPYRFSSLFSMCFPFPLCGFRLQDCLFIHYNIVFTHNQPIYIQKRKKIHQKKAHIYAVFAACLSSSQKVRSIIINETATVITSAAGIESKAPSNPKRSGSSSEITQDREYFHKLSQWLRHKESNFSFPFIKTASCKINLSTKNACKSVPGLTRSIKRILRFFKCFLLFTVLFLKFSSTLLQKLPDFKVLRAGFFALAALNTA